jgi:hypothetical protein
MMEQKIYICGTLGDRTNGPKQLNSLKKLLKEDSQSIISSKGSRPWYGMKKIPLQ